MDLGSPLEQLCYVRCAYCSTVLAVGVPSKRMTDTVTVKCGHCNSLSFLNPRPSTQPLCSDHHQILLQRPCNFLWKGQHSVGSSSSAAEEMNQLKAAAPFVMKPPEKKHRLPSAYNRFMREEIQRIKAAQPDIPHREAFSTAAKNWAKCDPRALFYTSTSGNATRRATVIQQEKRSAGISVESFDVSKQKHRIE